MSRVKYYNSDSTSWEYVNTTIVGSGLHILGYYDTLELLSAEITSPGAGDVYCVGTASPYDIYVYDTTKGWVNNGPIHGEKGDAFTYDDFTAEQLAALKGEKGDAFTYSDFTSEQLEALKGEPGKSAYEYAQEGGYTGTEEEFAEKLAQPSSGGSITSSDDGNGNVVLELFGGLSASDDGAGNVTIS